jgi:anti-sigma factor RsiW
MDGAHPEELDLLAYVEDDLPAERRVSVAEHVAGCLACADAVRQLETARHVLRSAPLLELPEERRSAVLAGLRERPTRRRPAWRPRIVAPALATAAVAAFVAGIVLTVDWNGGGGEEAADLAAPTAVQEESAGQTAPEAAAGAGENRTSALDAVLSVEGPPGEIARFLRSKGFDARVVDSTVRVRNANPAAVMRALADRPRGPVVVEVVP